MAKNLLTKQMLSQVEKDRNTRKCALISFMLNILILIRDETLAENASQKSLSASTISSNKGFNNEHYNEQTNVNVTSHISSSRYNGDGEGEYFTRTERSFHSSFAQENPQRRSSDRVEQKQIPYFDINTERNITYPYLKTVHLHCKVCNIGDRSVSWIRQRDLHILTVDDYTYSTDQRFTSIHLPGTNVWTLEIKYPHKTDAGVYECQINTEPKMSLGIRLNILVAEASITEGPVLYVQDGSHLNLTCVATQYVTPPPYVFWYHDGESINYDSHRGITVTTERGNNTTISRLHIHSARPVDSGNYSCQPSFADPANTTVHILNGEKPAAMQHGRQSLSTTSPSTCFLLNLFPMIFIYIFLQ